MWGCKLGYLRWVGRPRRRPDLAPFLKLLHTMPPAHMQYACRSKLQKNTKPPPSNRGLGKPTCLYIGTLLSLASSSCVSSSSGVHDSWVPCHCRIFASTYITHDIQSLLYCLSVRSICFDIRVSWVYSARITNADLYPSPITLARRCFFLLQPHPYNTSPDNWFIRSSMVH